jgi:ParB-like chromosome segregation protein Spo0J
MSAEQHPAIPAAAPTALDSQDLPKRDEVKLPLHPLCKIFPRLVGAKFEELKADIKANGLRHAIVTHQGMILDGGNRYAACIEVGVQPLINDYTGSDPVAYVLSANLHRRHLSLGQQAAIVASAQDWSTAQAVGKPKLVNVGQFATVAQRAAASGASRSTQKMADKVAKESPELAVKVAHGEISLPKAVQQAKAPLLSPEQPEDHGPDADEIAAGIAAERADAAAWRKLMQADDKLATAYSEIKRLNAELSVVKQTRDGFMNKANELIKTVKRLQAKVDKLERAGA